MFNKFLHKVLQLGLCIDTMKNILALVVYIYLVTTRVFALRPAVINTWNFVHATKEAWESLYDGGTATEALVAGCGKCESMQCDGTVGYGGSPDENGETTLDALIFDGSTMDMGAVGGLRRIKNAIAVAKHVLDSTEHSILVGSLATNFAVSMGFKEESLSTNNSSNLHEQWKTNKCQPNFWKNVKPGSNRYCGPYKHNIHFAPNKFPFYKKKHDTIGMIAIDVNGNIAAGTSSNGAKHKIPGRIGDAPIPGGGAYADSDVGAAVATGDGDIMMRFLPSFLAVEEMRNGQSPKDAAQAVINRIRSKYPNFFGAVVAMNSQGKYGAACNGMKTFPYCVKNLAFDDVMIEHKVCNKS